MTRKGEKGSVVSFIVVGVLLASLVIGGLYALKERSFFGFGEQGDIVVSDAGDEDTDETVSDVADNSSSESTTSEQDDASDQSTSSETDIPSDTTTDSQQVASEDLSDSSSSSSVDSSSTNASSVAASELPETGPADALLALLGPAALVGAILAYRRSYQL